MKAIRTIVMGLAALTITSAALAAERSTINRRTGLYEPPLTELRKASERGDRAELARTASRLGPNRLVKALADPDRRTVLAALEAAPLFAEGVLLLDGIVPLIGSTDDDVREHAVRSTSALLHEHDRTSLAEWEVSNETVGAACQALLRVASRENEKPAARLGALQGLADASAYCVATVPLAELAGKGPAEIRRAAVLALPIDESQVGSQVARNALVAASKDADSKVAAAAGARLCHTHTPAANATPLRQLVLGADVLAEDVVDMLPCLATSKDPADRKAIDQLAASGSPAVKAAIKNLK
jgi:hypothetical protein